MKISQMKISIKPVLDEYIKKMDAWAKAEQNRKPVIFCLKTKQKKKALNVQSV